MRNEAQGAGRGADGAEGHGYEEDGGPGSAFDAGGFARQTTSEAETMWRDRDR